MTCFESAAFVRVCLCASTVTGCTARKQQVSHCKFNTRSAAYCSRGDNVFFAVPGKAVNQVVEFVSSGGDGTTVLHASARVVGVNRSVRNVGNIHN